MMANGNNGIPSNCIDDPEVDWITVKLPVYTGPVSDRSPDHIDLLAFKIMTVDQRVGLNRVVEGYNRVYPAPAVDMSRPLIARWVFAQIGKAFESSKNIPRQSSMAQPKK